ncbi:MAG: 4Fe-4S dicluster domain-containing protein [Candidatus Zipacnadales bacterium]
MGTLRAQFRKAQACVGCSGCVAACPNGAITEVGSRYHIAENRCTHCLACVREIKAGCWAADSVHGR